MEVIEFGALTDAARAQLEGDEEDPFDAAALALRYRRKERHVAIRDGGVLVASAGLTTATVAVAGRRFDVVGIGGVIVRAERRGEGLARRVVEAALERARLVGPAFAVLFCHGDRAGLYARLGFSEVASRVHVEQAEGFVPAAQLMMWRPLTSDADWPDGEVTVFDLPF